MEKEEIELASDKSASDIEITVEELLDFGIEFAVKKYAMNYDFKYNCEGRIDTITPEIIGLLKATGCISVFVGLETGSQRIQRICRKT